MTAPPAPIDSQDLTHPLDSSAAAPSVKSKARLRGSDVVVLGLVVLGVVCRLSSFGLPHEFLFDEHHFVNNARTYLLGQADQNDHPPLGKLLIAAAIALLGDNSAAFRTPALILGFVSLGLAAAAASRLFSSRRAGLYALGLCAADGFLISYSRAALLDGYLACAGLALLLTVTFGVAPWVGLVAGVVWGLALSIKFSGVALALPILAWLALSKVPLRRRLAVLSVVLASALGTYCFVYGLGLHLAGQSASLDAVFSETRRLYVHHANLTDMKNPATSGWSTWWLPVRPLMLGYSDEVGSVRALSSLGNLAAWWSSVALTLGAIATIGWYGLRNVLSGGAIAGPFVSPASGDRARTLDQLLWSELVSFVHEHARAVVRTLLLAMGFVAPWVLTHRDSYIYHFLPAYSGMLVLLSGFLAQLERRHRFGVLLFLATALVVAGFYAPVWSFAEIDPAALRARLFMKGWR